ncbi:MAG: helix-turn-helix domain-containing protein [Deltaproteobacteria bacterium]|nr:helix-turn-helix domain-containing protein [Deltaproteobacteria bacterium]
MNEFAGLGQALRRLRQDRGLTQRQLAEACGSVRRVVNSIETGRNLPRLDSLQMILDALGCSLFEFLNHLELVNGRPPVRFRRLFPGPRPRRQRLVELLGLDTLPPAHQALFLAAAEDLRNLFSHLTSVPETSEPDNPGAPGEPLSGAKEATEDSWVSQDPP